MSPPKRPACPPTPVDAAADPPGAGDHSARQRAAATLGELEQELNRLQRTIRLAIQAKLGRFTGVSLESLEDNRQLAESIHQLLDRHGLRMQCSECGHPAILRVSPRAGIEHGAFVFDHSIDGRRTFHGGRAVVPEIRLVAKPARKKAGGGGAGRQKSASQKRA